MNVVVADSTPIHYLVLSDAIAILGLLYDQVVIPTAVFQELSHSRTPERVRAWIVALPAWAVVRCPDEAHVHPDLGLGEREAIALAVDLHAVEVLLDDKRARAVAVANGLPVTGTVGVLEEAAKRGLIELSSTLERLRSTNFRYEEGLFREALARDAGRKRRK